MRFAFYGRVSTEDQQDPESSRGWQIARSTTLIAPEAGVIVEEFFDVGLSRSLPWKRRPEAARLLASFVDPGRGFEAVVIGEPQRAFYGNQFGLTFPVFVHYGIGLWVPEVGGAVDPGSDAHELVMSLYGGMSKGERNRIKTRVRAAMSSQAAVEGRFLGGRPPFGYRLADGGPHPNPSKAADGRRLHRLEPDPDTAPIVERIFGRFRAGDGIKAIARSLTDDGILSPSAHDPARNPHRATSNGAWGQSAVKAILQNPRYTGYQVWNRQRRDEELIDVHDVALGHQTRLRWNSKDDWIWSNEPAHDAIVSTADWQEVQSIFNAGTRPATTQRRTTNHYLLKGMVHCSMCGRRMQGNRVRNNIHYRCVLKSEYPGADHPRSLSVREEHLLPAIDTWLATLFNEDNTEQTCKTLEDSQDPVVADADELAVRKTIKECDKKLANFRSALATAPSDSVARWIAETEAERRGAELRLRRLTKNEGMTADEIRDIVSQMQGLVSILHNATPEDRSRVYQAANLNISYDHAHKKAKLHASPDPEAWSYKRVGGGT